MLHLSAAMRSRPIVLALGGLLLGLLAALTIASVAPPAVAGVDAPVTEFSAARAMVHVEAIARSPHPVGSPAHEEVRAYLLGVLSQLGLEARIQEASIGLKAAGVMHAAHVQNVIARLPGTHAGPAVMLAAHYDSVPQSRGASDDASGVATLLETARALTAGPRLANDVVFLFSDAEEVATCGALAFTEDELARQPIAVALNFEARGTRGAVALYDTSDDNGALIDALSNSARRVVSTSLLGSLARALPNDSDASVLKRAGIPTYAFAYVDNLYAYHQFTDSTEALDIRSLQHDGDYALPLVQYWGNRPLPLPRAAAVAYFDVFGRFVVSYSGAAARALALLTLGGFGVLVQRARRVGKVTVRGGLVSALVGGGAVVMSVAASGLVHFLLHASIEPFVLFAHPAVAAVAGAVVGASVLFFAYALLLNRIEATAVVLGALTVWAGLLLATAAVIPAASFALQWPLLFAVAGVAFWVERPEAAAWRIDAALLGMLVPAVFFWSYLAYAVFVMAGAQAPEAVTVVVALALLLALPLFCRLGSSGRRRVAAGLAVAGVAIGVVGALEVRRSPSLRRPDSLSYHLARRRGTAKWMSVAGRSDAFTRQRLPAGHVAASAPVYELTPLEISSHSVDEGALRHATLTVASPRGARCIRFWEETHERVARARVDGRDVVDVTRFSPEIDEKIATFFTGGSNPASWVMEYCGAGRRPFTLELFTPAGKPVKIRVVEISDGLPGPPLAARTPADGYPDSESDSTQVTVELNL
jgi:hypothetical protein